MEYYPTIRGLILRAANQDSFTIPETGHCILGNKEFVANSETAGTHSDSVPHSDVTLHKCNLQSRAHTTCCHHS